MEELQNIPEENLPSTEGEDNHSNWKKYILYAVIILAVAGAGIFFVVKNIDDKPTNIENNIVEPNQETNKQAEENNIIEEEPKSEEAEDNIKEDIDISGWKTYENQIFGVEFMYPNRFEYVNNKFVEFRNSNFQLEKRSQPTPEFSFVVIDNEDGNVSDLCEYALQSSLEEDCENLEINGKKFVYLITGEMYPADSYYYKNDKIIIVFSFYQKSQSIGVSKEEINKIIESIKLLTYQITKFKIPELEIQLLLKKLFADELIYSYEEITMNNPSEPFHGKVVKNIGLSTKTLFAGDEECSSEYSAIGIISSIPSSDIKFYQKTGKLLVEFEDFNIYFSSPQSPCAFTEAGQVNEELYSLAAKTAGGSLSLPFKNTQVELIELQ